MASTMKPCPITNLEEEAEDGGAAVERSIFTQDDESTSVFVCDSPLFHDRDIDCDPYFPFAGHPISDSGSDSELDPYTCPIDFFDRETSEGVYLGSGGLTGDDFNIVLGSRCESGSGSDQQPGLRVTGLDSDSDYEDDVFNFTSGESENVANESGRVEVVTGLPPVWDYDLGDENEEWEEVRNAINWTVRAFSSSEDEEELSSQSRDDHEEEEEEEDHELDWQVLITINNVVNYIEQAEGITIDPGDIDPSYYMYLASLSDGDAADDAILGQMFDNEVGIRGNPPAAKRIVDDLPVVELTVEEGDVVCAVCKDEMVLEEEVKRLPCRHLLGYLSRQQNYLIHYITTLFILLLTHLQETLSHMGLHHSIGLFSIVSQRYSFTIVHHTILGSSVSITKQMGMSPQAILANSYPLANYKLPLNHSNFLCGILSSTLCAFLKTRNLQPQFNCYQPKTSIFSSADEEADYVFILLCPFWFCFVVEEKQNLLFFFLQTRTLNYKRSRGLTEKTKFFFPCFRQGYLSRQQNYLIHYITTLFILLLTHLQETLSHIGLHHSIGLVSIILGLVLKCCLVLIFVSWRVYYALAGDKEYLSGLSV
ncbi:unnamed protein product [Brassica rapa]|uniref:RING-type domain-containing protein n=1 Tax=Brassica campestris TaxID=3711 RepID=A0A8D9LY73_BRACM|nr:unnamed protein product [Brassica rapa]